MTLVWNFDGQTSPEVAGLPLGVELGQVVAALKAALVVAFLVEAGWVSGSLGFDQSCSDVWVLKEMKVFVGVLCWVVAEATWAFGTVGRAEGVAHDFHTRGPDVPSAGVANNSKITWELRFWLSHSLVSVLKLNN